MIVRTMTTRRVTSVCRSALAFSLLFASLAEAQFIDRMVRRATSAAEDEIGRKVEDLVRNGVRCAVGDTVCVERARRDGRTPVMTDADGKVLTDARGMPITDPDAAARQAAAPVAPGTGAWANYDFVPGERVLFADDFSGDQVGDFPRRFNLVAGNWEVVEWEGARFLRATATGTVSIPLPETLPERFTIEFPASVQHGNAYIRLSTGPVYHGDRSYSGSLPSLEYSQGGLRAQRGQGPMTLTARRADATRDALVTFRVMADGAHMKMYLNEHRVANAPNAVFPRTRMLYISVSSASEARPVMIGPIRLAAGGRDLYDALAKDGRVATQGIYFAVNSAVIRPESSATLREIGEMLRAHPDLGLTIEGHTDSDGDDAHNLDLSARRAEAVKAHLVEAYGIDAGRLSAVGLGETRPAADNATPDGKQQNRRVELVRQGN